MDEQAMHSSWQKPKSSQGHRPTHRSARTAISSQAGSECVLARVTRIQYWPDVRIPQEANKPGQARGGRVPRDCAKGYHAGMLFWSDVLRRAADGNPEPARRIVKSDAEWRDGLTAEEYRVTRQAGTERAFSSEMCSRFEPGLYSCTCCDTLLFDSAEKFESYTGWPSFTQPIVENAVAYRFDGPAVFQRVETVCNSCDAHLGHVFPDGPAPSGLRYCMNAVALRKASKD